MSGLQNVESELLDLLCPGSSIRPPQAVFVLGAPRTGSTVLYQIMCRQFGLPYISNLTNDQFAKTPIVGLALQKSLPVAIGLTSRYGKTNGPMQPSEGSGVMTAWFGGGHPSAIVSARALPGAEVHLLRTLNAAEALYDAPLLIKNAWNCFRVPYLAQTLPDARFIWIRRTIADAAKSDLSARYKTKSSAQDWNSATPANFEALKLLPPSAQVVENQHEFNRAVGQGLHAHAAGRWHQVWYEDLCLHTHGAVQGISEFLNRPTTDGVPEIEPATRGNWQIPDRDGADIDAYVAEQGERFAEDLYPVAERG